MPMHELAVCQALLRQVLEVAENRYSRRVGRIKLCIGPLAGVEPALLKSAFPLVAAGTPCEGATIEIENVPVRVRCQICGSASQTRSNRLLCTDCGTWRVTLISGDEMFLASVELPDAQTFNKWERTHV
jgi:hydrogenase nickel incorporation protein HypA/HybF